eukprot:SAG22_NODE_357_length_11761_cov_2.572115_5_plen_94_part_00
MKAEVEKEVAAAREEAAKQEDQANKEAEQAAKRAAKEATRAGEKAAKLAAAVLAYDEALAMHERQNNKHDYREGDIVQVVMGGKYGDEYTVDL